MHFLAKVNATKILKYIITSLHRDFFLGGLHKFSKLTHGFTGEIRVMAKLINLLPDKIV